MKHRTRRFEARSNGEFLRHEDVWGIRYSFALNTSNFALPL